LINFIHTSDLHLGAVFSQFKDKEKRNKEHINTFNKIISKAIEKDVDLFLLSGDLFNSISPSEKFLEIARTGIKKLLSKGIKVFIITGNHDYYIPGGIWDREFKLNSENLYIFKEPEFKMVDLPGCYVRIIGCGYSKAKKNIRMINPDNIPDTNANKIIIFHGSYDNPDFKEFSDFPFSLQELKSINFNYLALGHYHRHSVILDEPNKKAVYPGIPETVKFNVKESGKRCIIYGEIGELGNVKIEPIEIQTATVEFKEIDITPYEEIKDIEKEIRKLNDKKTYLNLKLTGTPALVVYRNLKNLEERFSENFASLKIDIGEVGIPQELPSDERYILGRFSKKIKENLEHAETEEEKVKLKTALRLVMNKTGQL